MKKYNIIIVIINSTFMIISRGLNKTKEIMSWNTAVKELSGNKYISLLLLSNKLPPT